MASQDARLSKFEADFKQQQSEMTNKINTVLKAITDRITGALPSDMVKNSKLNVNSTSLVLSARSYPTEDPQCSSRIYDSINANTICSKQPNKSHDNKPGENGVAKIGTKDEDHHTMVEVETEHMKSDEEEREENDEPENTNTNHPHHLIHQSYSSQKKFGCPSNLNIPCNIRHVHVKKAYIDLNSPLNVMTRMLYNWIMRKQLEPREDPEGFRGIRNFTGRIKGMHIFVGNFTYVSDFMIVEDISSIIDPRLFMNGIDEIAYKMPHKIEQYNSLSDLEKEHAKSVYFRNEEDKRRGVDYVMSKILGFYKECLELGPEYLTRVAYEGGVT
ncbi:hypothetical protein Tco_1366723 [Tanacetum coccineum]